MKFTGFRVVVGCTLALCLAVAVQSRAQDREIIVDLPGGSTLEMVWITPGKFVMGSPESEPGRDANEGPQHEVRISRGFYLGKYELTQAQWESVMGTQPWADKTHVHEQANYPAVFISWNDAQIFIDTLNAAAGAAWYRLPTEAEWEYACRAGTTSRWSFGDDESRLGAYAWYYDNAWKAGEQYAHAVGNRLPNPWGLFDMHGNVWEWVQDWHTTIVGIRASSSYPDSLQIDPTGPPTGSHRVKRGGSFYDFARYQRSAFRDGYSPRGQYINIGMRLLRQEPP